MKLYEITESVSGEQKNQLTVFMAQTASDIAQDVSGRRWTLAMSFAKRLVGSILHTLWFLRNLVVGGKQKHFERRFREIMFRPVAGAVKAMLVDHPEGTNIDPNTFTEAFIQRLINSRDELAQLL